MIDPPDHSDPEISDESSARNRGKPWKLKVILLITFSCLALVLLFIVGISNGFGTQVIQFIGDLILRIFSILSNL